MGRKLKAPLTASSVSDSTDHKAENVKNKTLPKRKKQKRNEKASREPPNLNLLQEKGKKISSILQELYPEMECPLKHQNHFQLVVAVLLSAQCADKIVNKCTPELFKRAPDPETMEKLEISEILEYIKTVNLGPTKAKHISQLSKLLVEEHHGKVPDTFEALEALPGVGHKTASVVMVHAFGQDAFPVDTHIHRLATRWGLSSGKSVVHTEADLKMIFPKEQWKELHLRIIYFGREHCPAKKHDPKSCAICSWATVEKETEHKKEEGDTSGVNEDTKKEKGDTSGVNEDTKKEKGDTSGVNEDTKKEEGDTSGVNEDTKKEEGDTSGVNEDTKTKNPEEKS